jgi:hypothetical protein
VAPTSFFFILENLICREPYGALGTSVREYLLWFSTKSCRSSGAEWALPIVPSRQRLSERILACVGSNSLSANTWIPVVYPPRAGAKLTQSTSVRLCGGGGSGERSRGEAPSIRVCEALFPATSACPLPHCRVRGQDGYERAPLGAPAMAPLPPPAARRHASFPVAGANYLLQPAGCAASVCQKIALLRCASSLSPMSIREISACRWVTFAAVSLFFRIAAVGLHLSNISTAASVNGGSIGRCHAINTSAPRSTMQRPSVNGRSIIAVLSVV